MNFLSTMVIEVMKDNLPFRLSIPSNTTFDNAHEVCLKIAEAIMAMKKQQEEQLAKQEKQS